MLLAVVAGCTSFSESFGDQKLAPVVAEVEAFRVKNARLPASFLELPAFSKLQLEEKSESGIVWSITLLRPSPHSYWLEFNHVHGVVRYVDGKKVYASGNAWR